MINFYIYTYDIFPIIFLSKFTPYHHHHFFLFKKRFYFYVYCVCGKIEKKIFIFKFFVPLRHNGKKRSNLKNMIK
ncbi:hypothetical protein CAPGI0001_0403 [Capnocytophaga gingivalis ATCC 33624]|nr:hypothetical protein CAPGI0001_0403 [Capnocytophaga gingivalis ATCC 33624]